MSRLTLETAYVIWANEHKGWWAPNESGYESDLRFAGVYSKERAEEIARNSEPGQKEFGLHDTAIRLMKLLVEVRFDALRVPKANTVYNLRRTTGDLKHNG